MDWSSLGNTFESIDEFSKDFDMIILQFDEIFPKDFLKDLPNIWFVLKWTMSKELFWLANNISHVDDLTIFNKTGSAVLDISQFKYDFLFDDNFSAFDQKIAGGNYVFEFRNDVISIINEDFVWVKEVKVVNRVWCKKLSLCLWENLNCL